MEALFFFIFAALVVSLIVGLIKLLANIPIANRLTSAQLCEKRVSDALRSMDMKSYVIFDNLILRSGGNTAHTEIDHVIVSPYGIFCIETKSHQGSIYGYTKSTHWKQYLGGKEYSFYNPYRQNYKHIEAIESLLGINLKAPVHSYVVFPNAHKVKVDGADVDLSINEVVRKITRHQRRVYNLFDCERILKTFAYASTKREELSSTHNQEVQAFLNNQ